MIPQYVKQQARYELARRHFWDYCHLTLPQVYKKDRKYLQHMCSEVQTFLESDNSHKFLIINAPPRHVKSTTIKKATEWLFGKDNHLRIMTASYNEILSGGFAKQVRNTIVETKAGDVTVYNDIFPNTRIKYGEASANMWALEGSPFANYLATSPTGTATGFGANILIVDDIIKSSEEAYNHNTLDKHWDWFNNTMLSRLEGDWKVIVIMTRWAVGDLAGRIITEFGDLVKTLSYKAVQDDGTMLCDEILSREDYDIKIKNMNKDIVLANFQQEPIDIKGKLYSAFKTYKDKPTFKYLMNYTDTADMGSDYLCSIDYGVAFDDSKYVLDILYTKEPMEVTEPAQAEMMTKDKIGYSKIESNNGGRGYARNVQKELKTRNNHHTHVDWFHQGNNKQSRILSNATGVMNNILFPEGWENKFPEFYKSVSTYQKEGKNEHDDAEDCLTGVYENTQPNVLQFGYNRII